ncbi:co-chaperone DjlA [Oceanobacter mangrovi]|uniref:co-chaperone DjlA n=1 Tax=Oceanobacter mangrovi TaxID=2862510 RepID=UPI001C8DCEFF|nr:co-chaperone DjlA [Oceanobacter mangrovi]
MLWMGKLMGSMVGLFSGGPFGAMVGGFVGHLFDQNLERFLTGSMELMPGVTSLGDIRTLFISSLYRCMGLVAKSDGRVSEQEIAAANFVMDRMELKGEARQQAIRWFQQGKTAGSELDADLQKLRPMMSAPMAQMFLEVVISIAYADGDITRAEWALIEHMSNCLGISQRQMDEVRARIESVIYQSRNGGASREDQLQQAYNTLEVSPDIDDDSLKKAYRKLMSQNHPDKLSATGVPEEMVRLAKEKTQQIQQAYALIRKARGS